MNEILSRLSAQFNPQHIVDWIVGIVPGIISGVITFLTFYVLWFIIDRVVSKLMVRAGTDQTARSFVSLVLKYVVLIIGLVSALSQVGIDTGSIIASLGVAGLTIGFAAKDTLSNLISGIFIFWDRPFVIGDLVEIGSYYGRVESITMRSTRVVTVDGKMLAIPNSTIVNGTVTSYTNFPHLRLDIDVTIGTGEDIDRATDVLMKVCEAHPDALTDPEPRVVIKALNDYNVALGVQVWIKDEKKHVTSRFALRRSVFEALRTAGVEMPFETFALAPVEVLQQDRAAAS